MVGRREHDTQCRCFFSYLPTKEFAVQMCYFCHTMQYNSSAPDHRSARCRDRANTHSQVPMDKRMYDHGQRVLDEPKSDAEPTSNPTAS